MIPTPCLRAYPARWARSKLVVCGASDISTYTTRSHVGDSSDKITLTTRISHHAQDQFNTYAVSEPGHAQRAKAEPSSSFVPLWAVGLAAFLVAGAVCSAIMKPVASRSVPGGGGASRGPMSVLRNWLLNVLGMLSLVPVRLATSRTRAWGAIAPSDLGPDAGEYGAVMQGGYFSRPKASARKNKWVGALQGARGQRGDVPSQDPASNRLPALTLLLGRREATPACSYTRPSASIRMQRWRFRVHFISAAAFEMAPVDVLTTKRRDRSAEAPFSRPKAAERIRRWTEQTAQPTPSGFAPLEPRSARPSAFSRPTAAQRMTWWERSVEVPLVPKTDSITLESSDSDGLRTGKQLESPDNQVLRPLANTQAPVLAAPTRRAREDLNSNFKLVPAAERMRKWMSNANTPTPQFSPRVRGRSTTAEYTRVKAALRMARFMRMVRTPTAMFPPLPPPEAAPTAQATSLPAPTSTRAPPTNPQTTVAGSLEQRTFGRRFNRLTASRRKETWMAMTRSPAPSLEQLDDDVEPKNPQQVEKSEEAEENLNGVSVRNQDNQWIVDILNDVLRRKPKK